MGRDSSKKEGCDKMSELEKRAGAQAGQESVTPPAKAAKKAKTPDKKKDKKPNRVVRWLKDLKGELKKVTWPSAKDTAKNVAVVIVCVLVVGVLIWVCDWVIKLVIEALLNLFG